MFLQGSIHIVFKTWDGLLIVYLCIAFAALKIDMLKEKTFFFTFVLTCVLETQCCFQQHTPPSQTVSQQPTQ